MKALAKEPDDRPPSMEVLAQELTAMGVAMFPGFGVTPATESDRLRVSQFGMMGSLRGAAAATGVYDRLRKLGRTKIIAAAGVAGLAITLLAVGLTSGGKAKSEVAAPKVTAVEAPVKVQPPPPPTPPAVTTSTTDKPEEAAEAETETASEEGEGESAETPAKRADGETASKSKTPRPAAPAAPDNKKLLADGERLLRAERFPEAREIFEKVAKSRRDRGPALVGLAEISFQEKKYGEAVRAAELAADKGGGVKARVLLGDSHFRLSHYKEAAKAYEDALKIDPGNASAKSGLALANKRM
jgi:Flp pilus assembly protein TadD